MRPPPPPPGEGKPKPRELRCRGAGCGATLGTVRGDTLTLPDGTALGPLAPGQIMRRRCPRCRTLNRHWLA